MKFPKHLEDRRDASAKEYCDEHCPSVHYGWLYKAGYEAAVADMLKEIEPLIEALQTYFDLADGHSLLELEQKAQDWQKKFGGEGE
jgi:hypothetical protein